MSDKDDLIIPEEIRQAWDEIEPILDYGNTILETFNSCGLICKKIPITGDVINFILVWDEEKSVSKAIANLGIDRIADLTIIISSIMDLGMTLDNIKDIENSREEAKKFTFNLIDSFTSNKTYKFNTHSLYPYYKNIQNSFTPLCSIDNKNSNLLKEFNFDSFSCNFYNNNIFNQSLKYLNNIQNKKDYINEYKIFLENLNYFSQEYNNYKLVSIQVINNLKIAYIQKLSLQDIDNININSELYLLKALYFCEDYVLFDKDKQALFDENIIKELEFDSSFYTIFISHKDKITDTYLNARKELYKSIDKFKKLGFKDLENAYQTYINSLIINKEINSKDETINKNENKEINKNLNQDENSNQENNIKENASNTKEQDFNLLSSHSKNLNHFILENKDKNKRIIFLNNASSMSNLIHIYDNHCDVFIKNDSLLDIKKIEKEYDIKFKEFNIRVFFYEKLLLGAKENNEFLFEEKEENLLYHFKYDKEDLSSLKDLSIKYNIYNARIKNYSSDYCKYYCKIA
ncbi:hypothetical protein [Campylobacter coli]|uniref:hypothetical protein n=2 Tax=Campylobacter coli TaxID=195 RepID=UPI0009A80980|nr:hypothetical protein [Campylobacter coli]HED6588311.1 hypothetical protein [Campylobacter coli]